MVLKYNSKLGRETAPYGDTDYTHKAVPYPEQLAEHSFPEVKVVTLSKDLYSRLSVTFKADKDLAIL